MSNIKEVRITPGYGGHNVDVRVYTEDKQTLILDRTEAEEIIKTVLNRGYSTSLKPRQQYERIHPLSSM